MLFAARIIILVSVVSRMMLYSNTVLSVFVLFVRVRVLCLFGVCMQCTFRVRVLFHLDWRLLFA